MSNKSDQYDSAITPELMQLEQRLMFDGAAVETTAEAFGEFNGDSNIVEHIDTGIFTLAVAYEEAQPAAELAQTQVKEFLTNASAQDLFEIFNGGKTEIDAEWLQSMESVRQSILNEQFDIEVQLLDNESMEGHLGAFTAAGLDGTAVIYLNESYLANFGDDVAAKVLIEELGHAIDAAVNNGADTAGDEGQLFADRVQGINDTASTDISNADDDSGVLTVDGESVEVEWANFNFVNAYQMITDVNNDGTVQNTEDWAEKEQESHLIDMTGGGLGAVTIDDDTGSAKFSGNDVSAIGINLGGSTYYGWISRPLKIQGKVVAFYFWTDEDFVDLSTAQADGNQDNDSADASDSSNTGTAYAGSTDPGVLDNKGFILVVDQSYFDGLSTSTTTVTGTSQVFSGVAAGTYTTAEVGSSSDRVDNALNSLLPPNSVLAVADTNTVNEDTQATGNLLTNDSDPNGDSYELTSYSVGVNTYSGSNLGVNKTISGVGTINISSTGAYTFTPVSNYNGPVPVIEYTIEDAQGATSSSTLSISITPVNDAPTAVNDSETIAENTPLYSTVMPNDSDPEGDQLTVTQFVINGTTYATFDTDITITGKGVFRINASGAYSFIPVTNFNGTVPTITYTISDGNLTDTADLNITVTAANTAPVANNDGPLNATTTATAPGCASGSAVVEIQQTGNVISNDTDPDGAITAGTTHEVSAVVNESGTSGTFSGTTATLVGRYGTLTINKDGSYSYDLDATNEAVIALTSSQTLNETFTYTLSETGGSGLSDTAVLTVEINGTNNGPTAVNDSGYVQTISSDSTSGNVLNNDIDLDNQPSVSSIGSYSTTYSIGDYENHLGSQNGTTAATVKIGIGASGATANAPISSSMTLLASTTMQIKGTGSSMTFTFNTLDDLDSFKTSNQLSAGQSYYVWIDNGSKDGYVELGSLVASSNVETVANDGTTNSIVGSYGTLIIDNSGDYTYNLTNSSLTGTHYEKFSYTVTDGSCTDDAVLTIKIVGPTPLVDTNEAVLEDASSALTGTFTQSDGSTAITISSFSIAGETGTFTLGSAYTISGIGSYTLSSNGSYSFTPAAHYNGPVPTITYVLADGSSAAHKIYVTPVNDAPDGTDKTVTITDKQTYVFSEGDFGFSDVNDDPDLFHSVRIDTLPAEGDLTLSSSAVTATDSITIADIRSGYLVYTPLENTTTASTAFTFSVKDDGGTANSGVDIDTNANTFTFNLTHINDVPVLDLDADDSTVAGTGFNQTYANGGTAVAIADTDDSVTDVDDTNMESAVIVLTNPQTGDDLTVGSLPSGITLDSKTSTGGVITITLIGSASKTSYASALQAITFLSSGTSTVDRIVNVTVNDGDTDSNVAQTTISVSADNRSLSVTGTTVNEASPYVQFQVGGVANQYVSLSLGTTGTGSGHAIMGTDFLPNLQYFNGSSWVDYTGGMVQIPTGGTLLVRTPVLQDTVNEGSETLKLTATNSAGTATSDNSTIKDDGTGAIFEASNNSATADTNDSNPNNGTDKVLDDDRPLTVDDIVVNEGSPFGVFTLGGAANQWVKLSLNDGTATIDANGTPLTDGTEDYGPSLEYWNGSSWTTYTANSFVQMDANGVLLVRTEVINDTPFENTESFFLGAQNTGGSTTFGSGTIVDDGTGKIYQDVAPGTGPAPTEDTTTAKNDDRTIDVVGGLTFNEDSTYATFSVTAMSGYEINLALGNTSSTTDIDADTTSFDVDYSIDDGATWTRYTWNGSSGSRPMVPGSTSAGGDTGEVLVRVDISSEDDTPYEGLETFTLTANYATNTSITDTDTDSIIDDGTGRKDLNGDGDVTDTNEGVSNTQGTTGYDDDRPVITISNSTVAEATDLSFSATLSNASVFNEVVTLSATLGSGSGYADSSDFNATRSSWTVVHSGGTINVAADGTLTLPAGVTAFTIKIPTSQDSLTESNETLVLNAAFTSTYVNDADTATGTITDVAGSADLVTVKTLQSSDATPDVGDTVTFRITVTNNGAAQATNVSLSDSMPTGITLTSSTPSQGTYSSGTWSIGTLANGASVTLDLTGTVDSVADGTVITNTTVKATADQTDPTDGGNDLTESVTVDIPSPPPPAPVPVATPEQPPADKPLEDAPLPLMTPAADLVLEQPDNELVVLRDIPEQRFSAGDGFTAISYQIPTDTFGHTETEAEITLSAVLADGQDLPKWLIFDPEKGEFRGIPPKGFSGTLMIRVFARNDIGDQVETMVTIDILSNDQTFIQNGKSDLFVQLQSDSQFSWRAARDQLIQAAKRMRG